MSSEQIPAGAVAALPEVRRSKFTFPFPFEKQFLGDPNEATLVPHTFGEELQAQQMSRGEKGDLAISLVKMSVVAVNGQLLSWADASKDTFMDGWGPKARQWIFMCYRKVNEISDVELKNFLALTPRIDVG